MLDEKDLQAIAQLLAQQKNEIMGEMDVRLAQQKSEIMHEVNLLMESYFDPKFNLLGHEEVEEVSDRVDVLEAVVKVHSREIEKLKKANHIA